MSEREWRKSDTLIGPSGLQYLIEDITAKSVRLRYKRGTFATLPRDNMVRDGWLLKEVPGE